MLLKVFLAVAVLLVIFLLVVALRPSEFRVERSTTLLAPPDVVFAQINDLRNWSAWSPWEKMDPAMKRTYSGANSGVGARFDWEGNREVGAGSMTIVDSQSPQRVHIKLEFLKPMKGESMSEFLLEGEGRATVVTWTMTGHHNFVAKAVSLFMDMDKMLGGAFEQGLASLGQIVETTAAK